jgi:ribosome-associated translation inhibitor RaiA
VSDRHKDTAVADGPRGGSDKRCHLRVVLAGLPAVVVEGTEGDLYVAIDRAADRAGRTLVRKIERRQTLLKQGWESVDKALYPGVETEERVPWNAKRLFDESLQPVSEYR